MQTFTGMEYCKIGLANAYGLDKLTFDKRIKFTDNLITSGLLDNDQFQEQCVNDAEDPAGFLAALYAIKDAMAGNPSGYMIGLDSCSSGMQIMGTLIGCKSTCDATGLIDPNRRADAYTDVTVEMNARLAQHGVKVSPVRKAVKQATMTHYYGSTAQPLELFGEDTIELQTFYEALQEIAPGACIVMEHLLNAWQPDVYSHEWVLPDGFDVRCPVTENLDFRVEVDELDTTFTHRTKVNQPQKKGLSIAANVIHSIDGMVVREIVRRCNYDRNELLKAHNIIQKGLRTVTKYPLPKTTNNFVSLRLASQLANNEVQLADIGIPTLLRLDKLLDTVLQHKPFPVVTVHDEFKCHPNNMNHLRQHYINIFAELSQSDLLADILAQIHGVRHYYIPKRGNITQHIYQSNYGLS